MLPDLAFDIQSLKKTYADRIKPYDIIREAYQRIKTLDDAGIFLALRDEAAVIEEAEELGSKPINSKPLHNKINYQIKGKAVRFDIYVKNTSTK